MSRPTYRGFRGARLRELREARGLSQQDLAAMAGTVATAVGKWERGDVAPEGTNVAKLATALGVRPQEFTDVPPELATMADLRVWAGLTRADAEDAAGLTGRRLHEVERVMRRPTEAEVAALSEAYGVPAEQLWSTWTRQRRATYPEPAPA